MDNNSDEEDCNIKGLFGSKKNIYSNRDRMQNLAKTALRSSLAKFDFSDNQYTYYHFELNQLEYQFQRRCHLQYNKKMKGMKIVPTL